MVILSMHTLCFTEGRGPWEKGIIGTTIKDTWTKSRGRVELGREGGSPGVGWRDGEKRHTTVIE